MSTKHGEKKTLGITSPDDKLRKKVTAEILVSVSTSREVVFLFFFLFCTLLSIPIIGIGWTLLANPNELLMDLRSLRSIQTRRTFATVRNQWLRPLRHFPLEEVQVRLASCPGDHWSCRLHCVVWTAVLDISSAAHNMYCCAALWTRAWLVLLWIPDLFWGGPGG